MVHEEDASLGPCILQPMHIIHDLTQNWHFQRQEADAIIPFNITDPNYASDDWRMVDLPHDWGIEGDYDHNAPGGNRYGFLPSGIAWYRREVDIDESWLDGRIELCFEGVYRKSDVYVNGHHVGHRLNGWIAFRYEIARWLQPGKNSITVRVDNSRQPSSRWYTGSGITRPVSLCLTPRSHIVTDGLVVEQEHRDDVVQLNVAAEIKIDTHVAQAYQVSYRLTGPAGEEVAAVRAELDAGQASGHLEVQQAQLWSPDDPQLYTLEVQLIKDGSLHDRLIHRLGLRSATLNAQQGFVLNGKSIKLKGFCIKEDHGPLGTAIPDKMWRQKLNELRAIGCNAIRCGHYPFSRIFYHICDELGFLVMDEFCDGWDKAKAAEDYGRDWHANWQRDLRDMIRLHRNHACVYFGPLAMKFIVRPMKKLMPL